MSRLRVIGVNFDHMHLGDLLRQAHENPNVEVVGVQDEDSERVFPVLDRIGLDRSLLVSDLDVLIEKTRPDLAILCSSTATHADWGCRILNLGVHLMVEKPFAASLEDADRLIAAATEAKKELSINWPIRWSPIYQEVKRLIDSGKIGTVVEVHHYGGNRGPLRHLADKIEVPEVDNAKKSQSWWYQKRHGGGSMLDYMGYGVTFATWFMDGRKPLEVTSTVDQPDGLEVDEHSITVARYETGLSKFETRWGTFTDPWVHQPQPKCGFIVVGTEGTLSAFDYEPTIRIQVRDRPEGFNHPVPPSEAPERNVIEYLLHHLTTGEPITGPLSPKISRIGQQIVDSAVLSAREKRTVALLD